MKAKDYQELAETFAKSAASIERMLNDKKRKLERLAAPYDSNTEVARLVNEHVLKIERMYLESDIQRLEEILNPSKECILMEDTLPKK